MRKKTLKRVFCYAIICVLVEGQHGSYRKGQKYANSPGDQYLLWRLIERRCTNQKQKGIEAASKVEVEPSHGEAVAGQDREDRYVHDDGHEGVAARVPADDAQDGRHQGDAVPDEHV